MLLPSIVMLAGHTCLLSTPRTKTAIFIFHFRQTVQLFQSTVKLQMLLEEDFLPPNQVVESNDLKLGHLVYRI